MRWWPNGAGGAAGARRLAALGMAAALALSVTGGAPRDARTAEAAGREADRATALARRGFELVGSRDGVAVYKHREAQDVRLVAEAVLPVVPERVQAALLDYDRQRGRIDRLAEVEVLERSANRLLVYQRLALPLVSDRDQTLLVRWGRNGDARWVTYEVAAEAGPPPKEGVVRLRKHSGKWQVQPGPQPGTTLLRFHVTIDMGGSLPKALAKAGAGRDVPDLFSAICHLAAGEGTGAEGEGGDACP